MTSKPNPPKPAKVDYIKVDTRFKGMVNRPDGVSIAEAVKRAEANVHSYKDTGLAAVDAKIAEMQVICAGLKQRPSESDERKIYLLSNDVFDAAGTFGQQELSEIAYSLCDLLGNRAQNVSLVWDAINVHISSMRLLRQSAEQSSTEEREAVLAGLKKVTARLIAEAAEPAAT